MTLEQPSSRPALKVACPNCGNKIVWSTANPWRPFCSQRCRMIDLGEWLSENVRIEGEDAFPDDSEDAQ